VLASLKVDIFNSTSGIWREERLSIGRSMLTATALGDLVFFAGGEMIESEGHEAPPPSLYQHSVMSVHPAGFKRKDRVLMSS